MEIFYVNQTVSYEQETEGGYLWSPQKNVSGHNNAGYLCMKQVKRGDLVFSNYAGSIRSVGVTISDCYINEQPIELQNMAEKRLWNLEGYMVDVEYHAVQALPLSQIRGWLQTYYDRASAFDSKGKSKQVYLSKISVDHALFIISELLQLDQSPDVRSFLEMTLKELKGEELPEYDLAEMEIINNLASDDGELPVWKGKKKGKVFVESPVSHKKIPKRDPDCAARALKIANYKCEYNNDDRLFMRKNGKSNYTEPHHLIPISKHEDFLYNLDVEENIVSLCSHCHNLLHYGLMEDKIPILKKLYEQRKEALIQAGIGLKSFEELVQYYR